MRPKIGASVSPPCRLHSCGCGSRLGNAQGQRPVLDRKSQMAHKPVFPATQRIGLLVFDAFEPIDVFGFAEAFAIARFLGTAYASPPAYPFEIFLIASDAGKVKSANGPSVAPDW